MLCLFKYLNYTLISLIFIMVFYSPFVIPICHNKVNSFVYYSSFQESPLKFMLEDIYFNELIEKKRLFINVLLKLNNNKKSLKNLILFNHVLNTRQNIPTYAYR